MSLPGNVLQVKHFYDVYGEECLNVFYYVIDLMDNPPIDPDTFGDELASYYTTHFVTFAGGDAVSRRVEIDDLTNGVEFAVVATNVPGQSVGDTLPANYAMNVTLPRASKITRNGSKRISGIPESRLNGGDFDTTGGAVTGIIDYCSSSIVLTDVDGQGSNVTLRGVIVGRTKNAQGVYQLDLTKLNNYVTPVLNARASTQATRSK